MLALMDGLHTGLTTGTGILTVSAYLQGNISMPSKSSSAQAVSCAGLLPVIYISNLTYRFPSP